MVLGYEMAQVCEHEDAAWLCGVIERRGLPHGHGGAAAKAMFLAEMEERGDPSGLCSFFAALAHPGHQEDEDLLCLAADRGYPNAMGLMALSLFQSFKDDEFFEWSRRAAEQGDKTGCYCLGRCYVDGITVQKDLKKGFDLWARQGIQPLGSLCGEDKPDRYEWRGLSAADGDEEQAWSFCFGMQKLLDHTQVILKDSGPRFFKSLCH
jgi:hypothetical protein